MAGVAGTACALATLAAPWHAYALAALAAPSERREHGEKNALRRSHTRADASTGSGMRVPLLVLIFSQRANEERRKAQRETWLRQRWQRGEVRQHAGAERDRASWRYVYVLARDGKETEAEVDKVVGDTVTLSAVREGYANLVYKTLEAVRWALRHVPFGVLLKTDDDSIVHVGRAAQWLHWYRGRFGAPSLPSLYAGRVFNDSQVIRHNFTRAHLLHPEWYPADFTKWAVPFEALATSQLTGGYYYPPYCSGGGYMLGASAARSIVSAFDVRQAAKRPIVRVEDAFVGILARESGVRPIDISEMVQDPPVGRKQEPSVFAGQLLVHRVADFTKAFEWITYTVKPAYEREARKAKGRGKGRAMQEVAGGGERERRVPRARKRRAKAKRR